MKNNNLALSRVDNTTGHLFQFKYPQSYSQVHIKYQRLRRRIEIKKTAVINYSIWTLQNIKTHLQITFKVNINIFIHFGYISCTMPVYLRRLHLLNSLKVLSLSVEMFCMKPISVNAICKVLPQPYAKHLSDQGTFTPVGAIGGFHGTPLRKPLFHRNFAMKFAPCMYALLETIIPDFFFLNVVLFQNGGQITDSCFASFWFWPKFEKPLFQRNFSLKFGSK